MSSGSETHYDMRSSSYLGSSVSSQSKDEKEVRPSSFEYKIRRPESESESGSELSRMNCSCPNLRSVQQRIGSGGK